MKIFCIQLDIIWENKTANYEKVRRLLDAATVPAGSLVLLPEMFSTGFSMNVAAIREDTPSQTETFLAEIARQHGAFVIGGLVTSGRDNRGRNEAVVIGPEGQRVVRYCKIHPFSFGGESQFYEAGGDIVTFNWHGFTVAPFICYDLRFPEIFRAAVRRGANLFTVIANWPTKRVQHWTTLLQARAIENQACVIGVNRTGNDPKLAYPGRSLIIDPRGEVLADGRDKEGAVSADADLNQVLSWRDEFPALQDIHPEFVK
ncbi:MAG: carbon-nitrogen family hydrolase [Verrucomicrobia bacterium]|nr:carbon-nitrogen family hydrolase [Verrucomicrobiota bacterium]